jgi:hypothetical protein
MILKIHSKNDHGQKDKKQTGETTAQLIKYNLNLEADKKKREDQKKYW